MIEIPNELIEEISGRKHLGVYFIAIDGAGGAGKSTAATELAAKLSDAQIIHIDDFYKPKVRRVDITEQTPIHSNFEFDRLKRQVLEPLGRLTTARYQTPEGVTLDVQPSGYIVIEGLGTLGKELRDYFDYKIWIDAPEGIRRERGIGRDTQEWTKIWDEEYLPQDARYAREQSPQDVADWVLSNG